MTFNPDRSKTHPRLFFNNNNVSQVNSQKYLGIILDIKLTFEDHLKHVFNKTKKTVGHLQKDFYF